MAKFQEVTTFHAERKAMDFWGGTAQVSTLLLDRNIKKLMEFEEETGWHGSYQTELDDLKTAVISMQEYTKAWEALYNTEEPPF